MKREYIIRKFVMAESLKEAIEIEKKIPAEECWRNMDWKPQVEVSKIRGLNKK